MKLKLLFLQFLISFTLLSAAFAQIPIENHAKSDSSIVYFTKDISAEGVQKIFSYIQANVKGNVGIKVHFGEEGNDNYLKPALIKPLTEQLNASLVETNVLYVSKRRYTASHIALAKSHGFDFAKIDILDDEGDLELTANTKHFKNIKVGSHIDKYQTIVFFSHFKGHGMAGFGGAIKNVSMGMASIAGKMSLHASTVPTFKNEKCVKCGNCMQHCPGGAIQIDPIRIDTSKCIGCGKCIGECPERVFGVPWGSTSQEIFLEKLVEFAKVAAENRNFLYINVLANISKGCDCSKSNQTPFMKDIGILVSTDIVAIEKASHDLVDNAHQCNDTFLKENSVSGKKQIDYAYSLGMGNIKYKIIDIDK